MNTKRRVSPQFIIKEITNRPGRGARLVSAYAENTPCEMVANLQDKTLHSVSFIRNEAKMRLVVRFLAIFVGVIVVSMTS